MDERATRDAAGNGAVADRRPRRRRTIDRPPDEAGRELMPGELADVLRDVADRLDAVLDDDRATSDTSRRPLEGTEGAVEAWSSVVASDRGRDDADLRRAALETTVLRIGPDGSLLERRSHDRRGSDRGEAERRSASGLARDRRASVRRASDRQEADMQPSQSAAQPRALESRSSDPRILAPRQGVSSATEAEPQGETPRPSASRPNVDERLQEARRQLEARRTAAEAEAKAAADASWRRGAALAVVRNVAIGVAIGVVIAVARVVLT